MLKAFISIGVIIDGLTKRFLYMLGAIGHGFASLILKHSWAKFLAGSLLAYIAFVIFAVYILPIFSRFTFDDRVAQWSALHERSKSVMMIDRNGDYLGYLYSGSQRGFRTEFTDNEGKVIHDPDLYLDVEGIRVSLLKDHKTSHVEQVPPYFWKCAKHLEDRYIATSRNPFGVDFKSTLLSLPSGRGGSTITMQLFRSLEKDYPSNQESRSDKLSRKYREILYTPSLQHFLYSQNGEESIANWVSNHTALIQGGFKYDVVGVEGASRVLFGKSHQELTIAEQLILADAILLPFYFNPNNNFEISQSRINRVVHGVKQKGETDESYFNRLSGRAARCALSNYVVGDADRNIVIADLLEFRNSIHRPKLSESIAATMEEYIPSAFSRARNPELISNSILIGGARFAVVDELRNRFGNNFHEHVKSAQLTLGASQQITFSYKMWDAIGDLQSSPRWCARSRGGSYIIRSKTCVNREYNYQIPITVSVADETGKIVRFFSTDQYDGYFGGIRHRDSDGFYSRQTEDREIASLGKVAAAILIGETGSASLKDKYSNSCLGALTSRKCFRPGSKHPRFVSPETAFGESLNDAVIRQLGQTDQRSAKEFMAKHGFSFLTSDSAMSQEDTPEATRIALGRYSASPQNAHSLMMTTLDYIQNNPTQSIKRPTFFESLEIEEPIETINLDRDYTLSRQGRSYVRSVLSAPLCLATGTLRRAGQWCASRNDRLIFHFSKTGTRGTGVTKSAQKSLNESSLNEYDWWIGGGFETIHGSSYTYIIRLGTGSPAEPFSSNSGAGTMASLIGVIIEDLINEE